MFITHVSNVNVSLRQKQKDFVKIQKRQRSLIQYLCTVFCIFVISALCEVTLTGADDSMRTCAHQKYGRNY
jgi:hypothetical protein